MDLGHLNVEAPAWLLAGIGFAGFFCWVTLTRRREVSLPLPRLRAGLKSGVALLLALALARPTSVREHRDVQVVVAVDVSDSMTEAAVVSAARDVLALQARATAAGRPQAVRALRFAGITAELPEPPARATSQWRLPGAAGNATDLGQALGLALGLFDPEAIPRLLLLSDGRATRGDARSVAERARARGIPLYYKLPPAPNRQDTAVTQVHAPVRVRPHATFELEATILATSVGSARVRLIHDGVHEEERSLRLEPGTNHVRFTTRVDTPGPAVYRVELLETTPNGPTENDAALTVVTPEPQPHVLLVAPTGELGSLARALGAQAIDVEHAGLDRVASDQGLDAVDLVILAGSQVTDARPAHATRLRKFVEAGGGLLVAFGGGSDVAEAEGPIAQLSPLRPTPLAERHEPALALGLVIDRSGSMSGSKLELTKEAARGTAELLAAQDLITVVVFDSQPQTVIPLQEASNRQRILAALSQIRASGGTNILPGLRDAIEQLLPARAKKKHVIVLSDGQSPSEGILDLIEEAASARITVSTVGVGDGADLALLQSIAARGRGRFHHARDPATIPRIFSRETTELVRAPKAEHPTPLVQSRRAEILSGLALAKAPPLLGHTRMSPRRDAEVLIETPEHGPLLARAPLGLGQVAAWASDLDGSWSAQLARWPQFPKLWAQVARGLMRQGRAPQADLELTLREGRVVLRLDARAAVATTGPGLAAEVDIIDVPPTARTEADLPKPRASLPLIERAPGLYEGEVEAGAAGALLATVQLHQGDRRGGPPLLEMHGRLSLPPSPELTPQIPLDAEVGATEPDPLAELAARTGGRKIDDLAPLLEPGPARRLVPTPLQAPVVLAALALFLAEVGIRRATFRGPRPLKKAGD